MEVPLQRLPAEVVLQIFYRLQSIADALALRRLFHHERNKEDILESVVGSAEDLDRKYGMKNAFSGKGPGNESKYVINIM